MERNEMVTALENGVVNVEFVKNNGEVRQMKATLLKEYVEPLLNTSSTRTRKPNPDVISVIDTELNEWRSFRIDSVKKFEA